MLWKENCCGSSVRCKTLVVVEAVVLCVVCVLVAVCCSVCCSVAVCCCCCGRVVVVGTRGGAGVVVGSSLLPRDVSRVVAAVGETTATQSVANLDVDDVVPLAAAVVASAARRYLDEEVGEGSVGLPVAKAQAARC